VAFRIELRDCYPRLYAFLIYNHIVHMGTGKYLVADYGDVKAIETGFTAIGFTRAYAAIVPLVRPLET
jgi:hypothetical protein